MLAKQRETERYFYDEFADALESHWSRQKLVLKCSLELVERRILADGVQNTKRSDWQEMNAEWWLSLKIVGNGDDWCEHELKDSCGLCRSCCEGWLNGRFRYRPGMVCRWRGSAKCSGDDDKFRWLDGRRLVDGGKATHVTRWWEIEVWMTDETNISCRWESL